jgi:hypothetical protein
MIKNIAHDSKCVQYLGGNVYPNSEDPDHCLRFKVGIGLVLDPHFEDPDDCPLYKMWIWVGIVINCRLFIKSPFYLFENYD